jgi:type III secretion system YscQ/HrcQ family protein
LPIRRDGLPGRLCVPAALAARWADRAIAGRELFAPVRALGPAERGVLTALLSPVLDPAGWSFAIASAAPLPQAGVVLRVDAPAGNGTLWLQAPPEAGRSPHLSRASALPIEVGVRVAATTVSAKELADLAPGDIVLFDGTTAGWLASGEPAAVRLVTGAFQADARVEADGRLAVGRGWRPASSTDGNTERKDVTMDPEKTDPAAAALAAAPVEVVAELGRLTLRGDEVLGLAPGVVLGLRVDRASAVSLRIGGAPWAEGELVNVEGELGVRVTRLLPR